MGIGKKIKQRREALGMTQDELAKIMGYSSRSTINKIENEINDVTQSKVIAFAKALDTTPSWLMDWNEDSYGDFGNKIYELRTKKNISFNDMAKELHISTSMLKQYESGSRKIPIDILEKISNYFNVDINEIIGNQVNDDLESVHFDEQYKKWKNQFSNITFTNEEIDKIIDFAKFLISQRK